MILTSSSTQIPHAVGAAYSLKMDKIDACVVTYFGDGGTSEVTYCLLLSLNLRSKFFWFLEGEN